MSTLHLQVHQGQRLDQEVDQVQSQVEVPADPGQYPPDGNELYVHSAHVARKQVDIALPIAMSAAPQFCRSSVLVRIH